MKVKVLHILVIGILYCGIFLSGADAAEQNPVVVELFTSQGCSSCPPAESVLSDLKDRSEQEKSPVYFLAFHVTYWDYIGWKDPFGDEAFTNRQRVYAHTKKEPNLFTPQFRVNGGLGFSDHNGKRLAPVIQKASASPPAVLCDIYEVKVADKSIQALVWVRTSVFANPEYKQGKVYVALTEDGFTTDVRAGENKGRQLKSDAVVRWFEPIGKWKKNSDWKKRLTLPRDPAWITDKMRIVIFAQDQDTLTILGATANKLSK